MFYSSSERERERERETGSSPTNRSLHPLHLHQNRSFMGKIMEFFSLMQCDSVVNCFQLQLLWRFLKVTSISTTSNGLTFTVNIKWHLQPILPPICDTSEYTSEKKNREWEIYSLGTCWILKNVAYFDEWLQARFFFSFESRTSPEMCIKKVNRVNFDVMLTSKVKTWSIDWDLESSLYPWAGHLTSGVTPGRLSRGKCTVSCFGWENIC